MSSDASLTFTLCIPTMNRYEDFLFRSLPMYVKNPLISNIIITDENGEDANKILKSGIDLTKFNITTNNSRLGPLLNKLKACSYAKTEWIALIDSDNFADESYFQKARDFILKHNPPNNSILAPDKASPCFNYTNYSDTKIVVCSKDDKPENINQVLLNTGNYVLNKSVVDMLDLTKESENVHKTIACDVIFLNTLLFEQINLQFYVVGGMDYTHIVHSGSIYTNTHSHFSDFNRDTTERHKKFGLKVLKL